MIPRTIAQFIKNNLKNYPVISVTGPRQSGKTTLLKSLFSNYRYVNLELPDVRQAAEDDPRRFLSLGKDRGMVIDEAQRVPHLFPFLQGIVDESGKMGQYVISGSQNFLLMESVTQSLAGRVAVMNLLPFSLTELEGHLPERERSMEKLLQRGMYPALYDRRLNPYDYHMNYIQTYVERDVRSLKNIGDLSLFRKFVQLCAGRTGQILNKSSLANDLGIDQKTVSSWLSVLEAGFIIFMLQPYHKNFNKRVIKHPKLYFHDTGLAASLLGIRSAEELKAFHLRGEIFENFVISDYIKQMLHRGRRPACYYWRDNTGNEIDLLVESRTMEYAVEIKSGMTINPAFFNNLVKFQKYSGITRDKCFLVYGGDEIQERKQGNVISWKHMDELFRSIEG